MMDETKTPYELLGVAAGATEAEIKKAYRHLAKELHPDLTGGDAAKADRFKAVAAAYDLLRDPEKRRRYDAGEIDASGQERSARGAYRQHAEADPSGRYDYQGGFDDLGDLFRTAFRRHGGTDHRGRAGFGAGFGPGFEAGFDASGDEGFGTGPRRGADLQFQMQITLREALAGGRKSVTLPDAGRVEITIPRGIADGQTLRLAGKGAPGLNGGAAGDALITLSIAEDPLFRRDGLDLHMELPVSIDEAVLGGTVEVDLPGGRVRLKVPPNSSSGRVMRLRGKGVTRAAGRAAGRTTEGDGTQSGDLFVTLRLVLASQPDEALAEAIRDWRKSHGYDPRAGWGGEGK